LRRRILLRKLKRQALKVLWRTETGPQSPAPISRGNEAYCSVSVVKWVEERAHIGVCRRVSKARILWERRRRSNCATAVPLTRLLRQLRVLSAGAHSLSDWRAFHRKLDGVIEYAIALGLKRSASNLQEAKKSISVQTLPSSPARVRLNKFLQLSWPDAHIAEEIPDARTRGLT